MKKLKIPENYRNDDYWKTDHAINICKKKVKYMTELTAQTYCDDMNSKLKLKKDRKKHAFGKFHKTDSNYTVYQCKICKFWHTTTSAHN